MNAKELFKIAAVAVFTTGLAVGCASGGSESTVEPEVAAEKCEGASPEAKNAIYAAKLKNARAKNLGFDSTANDKLIKAAEQAAADCKNVRAISLVNRAEAEADKFIAKYHADQAAVPVAEVSSSLGSYLVQSGDNLWNIAGQDAFYGNPYQWPLIYKDNVGQIKDADLIFPGQTFNIPKAMAGESAAAIAHAKSRGAWTLGATEASDLDYLAQ
ncbi:MAG: nucleoid-associated protein YgaU [Gammaproteobacteria bacterium]|jgi:nucleoid-associated protein YgaU